jgi:hypothetical protein
MDKGMTVFILCSSWQEILTAFIFNNLTQVHGLVNCNGRCLIQLYLSLQADPIKQPTAVNAGDLWRVLQMIYFM